MDLIQQLTEAGYAQQAQALAQMAKESVLLATSPAQENSFRPGESKIGGHPHLPKGYDWPWFQEKPLAFLAQINLADVAAFDTNHLLPKDGVLSFFYEGGVDVWGFDPQDKGGWRVFWFEGAALTQTPPPEALEDALRFRPCKVSFQSDATYPTDTWETEQTLLHDKTPEQKEAFWALWDAWEEEKPEAKHRLFGHPELVQGDIFLEAQLASHGLYCGNETGYNDPRAKQLEQGVPNWLLLLQLDTDDNADMMWGDVGTVYFTIPEEDLAARRFEHVWLTFQCG
jgi:uncharacterized protein YwqG